MNDLIERLEKATEGSRELDAEIARTFGWREDRIGAERCWRDAKGGLQVTPPCYTTSLDEALKLAPDQSRIDIRKWENGEGHVIVWPTTWGSQFHRSTASTPALALCIAALRARIEDSTS